MEGEFGQLYDLIDPDTGNSIVGNVFSEDDRDGHGSVERTYCSPYAVVTGFGQDSNPHVGLVTENGLVLGGQAGPELVQGNEMGVTHTWITRQGVLLAQQNTDYVFATETGAAWSIPADVVANVEVIGGHLWVTNPSGQVIQVDLDTGSEESFPGEAPPFDSLAFWAVPDGYVNGVRAINAPIYAVTPTQFDWGCGSLFASNTG
jgi:hypothetical protein